MNSVFQIAHKIETLGMFCFEDREILGEDHYIPPRSGNTSSLKHAGETADGANSFAKQFATKFKACSQRLSQETGNTPSVGQVVQKLCEEEGLSLQDIGLNNE